MVPYSQCPLCFAASPSDQLFSVVGSCCCSSVKITHKWKSELAAGKWTSPTTISATSTAPRFTNVCKSRCKWKMAGKPWKTGVQAGPLFFQWDARGEEAPAGLWKTTGRPHFEVLRPVLRGAPLVPGAPTGVQPGQTLLPPSDELLQGIR